MWRFRLILLPFSVVFELLILATYWGVALVSKKKAKIILDWATSVLPTLNWYIGN